MVRIFTGIKTLFLFFALSNVSSALATEAILCPDNSLENIVYQVGRSLVADPRADNCQLPAVGQHRDINLPDGLSPTLVSHKYRIVRQSPKRVNIVLNLTFFQKGSAVQNVSNHWKKIINKCLVEMKDKFVGSNGEVLNLEVYKGPENGAPSVNYVEIRQKGRANSEQWTEGMDCSTVVHEMLHLAGLVDEYKESFSGYVWDGEAGTWKFMEETADNHAFDCRKIYSQNNIMANSTKAYYSALSPYILETVFCECAGNEAGCDQYIAERKTGFEKDRRLPKSKRPKYVELTECPQAFKPSKFTQELPVPLSTKMAFDQGKPYYMTVTDQPGLDLNTMAKMVTVNKVRAMPANERILLEPRQIDSILYPGCYNKNSEYYQDSQNAYRTSRVKGGQGCYNDRLSKGRR